MKIDTSLGYNHWISVVASIIDNPLDSIHSMEEMATAVAEAFNEKYDVILGHAIHELVETKEAKWEITG
jgi:hypothetical protein